LENESTARLRRLAGLVRRLSQSQQIKLLNLLEQCPKKDFRKYPRKGCLVPVDYSSKGVLHKDYIENLSAGGMFVKTKMSFFDTQEITMVFSLPNYAEPFKIAGTVAWTGISGIGVKFNSHNPYIGALLVSV